MTFLARPYRDPADLAAMRQLLILGWQASRPASYMPPGFFDFATHFPPDPDANRRNLRLWEDAGGALAAWSIFLEIEGSFDLFVHPALHGTPAHAALLDEYLAWAEARARQAGLASLFPFWVVDDDEAQLRLLQARGFEITPTDPAPPLVERALDDLPTVPLASGFTVQGVRTLDDARLRAAVTHAAFRPDSDWNAYWDRYARFYASPVYPGELDLFVRSPDGRGASACTLWLDPDNSLGLFEPVATHPDFQRLGLGKAVMAEGLRRLRALGLRRAILGFDPNNAPARALYTSLGFRPCAYYAVARKPL